MNNRVELAMLTPPTPLAATQISVLCVDTNADAAASHAERALLRDWHAAAARVARALGGKSGPFNRSHALQAVFSAGADHAERALQCALTLLAQARQASVVRHSDMYLSNNGCQRSLGTRDFGQDVRRRRGLDEVRP